jgi:nucleoside diphosphate kinase
MRKCSGKDKKYSWANRFRKAPAGTIRGDFGLHKMRNIAHASDRKDAAEKEIARFFK